MNVAVVGLGRLGKIHARIYKELKGVNLKALCDINPSQKNSPGLENIPFYKDYKNLLKEDIQAVSIATPTTTHFKIAKFFLEKGISCLVEKPLSSDLKEANRLLRLARQKKTFLLVGMVERFNPAYQKIRQLIKRPRFIEAYRLSPFSARSLDISVVLDLMIHDLDIVLDLLRSPIKKIEAIGVKVLSKNYDIVKARIYFKNASLAELTASRVSEEKLRKIRLFLESSYISLDYAQQEAKILKKEKGEIKKEKLNLPKDEPLKKEIEYFLESIKEKKYNYLQTQKAINSLETALKIERAIRK